MFWSGMCVVVIDTPKAIFSSALAGTKYSVANVARSLFLLAYCNAPSLYIKHVAYDGLTSKSA